MAAAASLARNAPSSWMVLMSGAGKTTVVFLSTPISTRLCKVAELQREGVGHHGVGRLAERGRGQRLAFGGDDLRPLLSFRLGLTGHRPLHAVGELDVLQLHQGHHHAPLLGRHVEDLADVDVDAVGLGQRLVQRVLADHLAQGGLRDLVDGGGHVLDRDHRLRRVDHPVVGDRGDVDADVVPRDDALGLDRHRDDAQRHPAQHVDHRHDDGQAGLPDPHDPPQPEQHTLLVLLHDPERQQEDDEGQHGDDDKHGEQHGHFRTPLVLVNATLEARVESSPFGFRPFGGTWRSVRG